MHLSSEGSGLDRRQERFRSPDLSMVRRLEPGELERAGTEGEDVGLPNHLSRRYICMGNDYAVVRACRACGGRHEARFRRDRMVDVRSLQRLEERSARFDRAWIEEHSRCPRSPRRYQTPELVQEFATMLEQAGKKSISAGTGIPDTIFVLDKGTAVGPGRGFRDCGRARTEPAHRVRSRYGHGRSTPPPSQVS